MCNIVKFDKNFKIRDEDIKISYFFIIGKMCLYNTFSNDLEAISHLKELLAINSNVRLFKSISNKDGTNERMYSIEI